MLLRKVYDCLSDDEINGNGGGVVLISEWLLNDEKTGPIPSALMSLTHTSIIMGSVWAIWHIWQYIQTNNGPTWIIWQALDSIPLRILIVWLYNNTGKSILAGILFHAMLNVSQFSFPNYGSHYDPFISGIIFASAAAIVIFLWGPRTFTRYRFA